MSNPQDAAKYMGDHRVQKLLQAIQKTSNPADIDKMKQNNAGKAPESQPVPQSAPKQEKQEQPQPAPKKEEYTQPQPPSPPKQ